MKVTFVSYIYPYPERGFNPGIERVVQELAHELANQGHEINVITTYRNGGAEKYEEDQGVCIHRISDTRRFLGRAGSLFSFDLLSLNYSLTEYVDLLESSDVVHAFTPIVWKFFSTPLVAHYHHWDEASELMEYLYLPTSHRLWMRCYDLADRVIAVSEYSADDLAARGIDRSKIEVVPNGVDTDTYHPGESSIEIDDWENVLLYVGPLIERKGLKYLIQSLPDVLEAHPDTGLILVGGGETERLEEMAKELGVRDSIRFEGFVPEGDLPEYYRAADIFVFPSLLEGFGMVLIEAMASGLPVVSTTTSAIPEVVGKAGKLVPPKKPSALAEAISSTISHDRHLKVHTQSLARIKNKFTWGYSCKKLLSIYENA